MEIFNQIKRHDIVAFKSIKAGHEGWFTAIVQSIHSDTPQIWLQIIHAVYPQWSDESDFTQAHFEDIQEIVLLESHLAESQV